jgi:hypothetical protein
VATCHFLFFELYKPKGDFVYHAGMQHCTNMKEDDNVWSSWEILEGKSWMRMKRFHQVSPVIIWLRSKVWGRTTMPCFKTLILFASRFYNWEPFPIKKGIRTLICIPPPLLQKPIQAIHRQVNIGEHLVVLSLEIERSVHRKRLLLIINIWLC